MRRGAEGEKATEQQVDQYRWIGGSHLGHARLAGVQALGQGLLLQALGHPPIAQIPALIR